MGRSVLRVATTVLAVAASVVSSAYVFGADGYSPDDEILHTTWLSGLSFLAALAAAVLLYWRHRWPVLVTGLALVPPLLLTADAFAALVALAALAASRRDRLLWLGTALVLGHLLTVGKRPNVAIRILPFAAGAHRALGVGFYFLRLASPAITRVYIEGLTDATYIHEPDETAVYEQDFAQLWAMALDEHDSASIVRRRIGTE